MTKPSPVNVDAAATRAADPDAIILDIELDNEAHTFAFSRPKRIHLDMALSGTSQKPAKALANMVSACLIAPTREEASIVFDYYPAAVLTLAGRLLEAVGLKEAELRP